MPLLLDEQDRLLRRAGCGPRVSLAYQLVAPLLLENEAISKFVVDHEAPGLRAALPELLSVEEALNLACQEYRLSALEQRQLKVLLERLPTT